MILDYTIKLLGSVNTLWGIPPQRIITDRKQPHRKTGIAKARREAKKRRTRKLNGLLSHSQIKQENNYELL